MKKLSILVIMMFCLSLIALPALAADNTTTTQETKDSKVEKQKTDKSKKQKATIEKIQVPTDANAMVHVSASGKKYHASASCSRLSNSKEVNTISLNDANAKKLTPCKTCYIVK